MTEADVELINKIVKIVLNTLSGVKESVFESKKVTAVFTGGKVDLEKSLIQLKSLDQRFNIDWQLIFSKSAEDILDCEKIAEELDGDIVESKNLLGSVKDKDLIIVPVLTMNSAAKLASHILDSYLLYYVFKSLIMGVPVIAAKNAADLNGDSWRAKGLTGLTENLLVDNQKHLQKLSDYGIKVVDAQEIEKSAANIFDNKFSSSLEKSTAENLESTEDIASIKRSQNVSKDNEENSAVLDNKVISYKEINPLADSVEVVYVRDDAVVTPYARDIAENKGMIICTQQK